MTRCARGVALPNLYRVLGHSSNAEVVELTLNASFHVCVARFLQSMGVELEEGLA